jgi:PhnB protein
MVFPINGGITIAHYYLFRVLTMKPFIPYLILNGEARAAAMFYAHCLNAELFIITYGEGPEPCPASSKDKIMHARISKGPVTLMVSDAREDTPATTAGTNFYINIDCENIKESEQVFAALSENGEIIMPLAETFWAHRFAMLRDQFGIGWMINVGKEASSS